MSRRGGNVNQATGASANGQATQGLQQAHFIQRKLKGLYDKTYKYLAPNREVIEKLENVLVWKEPLMSAALYISIHWIFIVFAQTNYSFATRTGNFVFWIIIGDVMWKAATNQFRSEKGIKFSVQSTANRKKIPISFENAVIKRSTPLQIEELPAFEVICLWIAELLMWLDNLFIAFRHWSVNDPYLFFACLLCPGLFLSLLGKYVPTMVVAYIAVIALLTLPYIEYHDLRSKVIAHTQTRFPQALNKVKSLWVKLKKFASKDQTEFPEVALHSRGDEAGAEQALQNAFEQVNSPSTTGTTTAVTAAIEPRPPLRRPRPPLNHDTSGVNPGASILNSVLGLHPNAFQGSDNSLGGLNSLSLGPGEGFPSISNLDESLMLPPRASDPQGLNTMPSINEEDDMVLPERTNSHDLDPFLDSIEVEYGGYNYTDGRPRPQATLSHNQTRPPVAQQLQHGVSSLDQITEEPRADVFGTGQTGFDTGYDTTGFTDHTHEGGYMHQSSYDDTYFPPPPPPNYQSAVDGTDGGITAHAGSRREESFFDGVRAEGEDAGGAQKTSTPAETLHGSGGYWLRQRH